MVSQKVYSHPDIYLIEVPLPDNPLKSVNSYVITTPGKNLIVDTGFALPDCLHALKNGLCELAIDLDKTEIFLTHYHLDHAGLAFSLLKEDATVYMSQTDYRYFNRKDSRSYLADMGARSEKEGFPKKEIGRFLHSDFNEEHRRKKMGTVTAVGEQSRIEVGPYQWTCVETPGHTPGHMCLYLREKKLMIMGDHVLFDISPNITFLPGVTDALGDYLQSLRKVQRLEIETALVGHKRNGADVHKRINELIGHHSARLREIQEIVREKPGLDAYHIAENMKWSVRGMNWDDLPFSQRWLAFAETVCHLDHLVQGNEMDRLEEDGAHLYFTA